MKEWVKKNKVALSLLLALIIVIGAVIGVLKSDWYFNLKNDHLIYIYMDAGLTNESEDVGVKFGLKNGDEVVVDAEQEATGFGFSSMSRRVPEWTEITIYVYDKSDNLVTEYTYQATEDDKAIGFAYVDGTVEPFAYVTVGDGCYTTVSLSDEDLGQAAFDDTVAAFMQE